MANLTATELKALEDQLNSEQLMIKKFHSYAGIAQDQMIKDTCTQIANQHRKHFDALMGYLN